MSAEVLATSVPQSPRPTALNAVHRQIGAKMVDFSGWDMPVEYPCSGGLVQEHLKVRTAVGLFDVSHMGDIRVHGRQALAAIQHISMNDASKLAIGQAQYSAMLYTQGTFVDDIIVHKMGEDDYLIVINAGTRSKDVDWVRDNCAGFDCQVDDLSDHYTQIAIQGPKAAALLAKRTDVDLSTVKSYWFTYGTVCGLPHTMIARTGYTGEDGFEIYVPSDEATSTRVWNELMAAGAEFGVVACGLGSRNTLRLEAKLPLYGHEISDTINVWEACLGRWCKPEKGDFIGRAALEAARIGGLTKVLAGIETVERGIARDGYKIFDEQGTEIGYVTSGSPGPFLKRNIALAYLPPAHSAIGSPVRVEVRSQRVLAQVVATPFYKRPKV